MAETTQEKTNGLKFAEQQLLRHGWEKGKGLGRRENGIPEAIKVKIKCDKGGMGHKEGDQFTFHWWDHVFNKASSSLLVETGQDGVMVKAADDGNDDLISNKKPRKAQQVKSMLYGSFVKSATLLSGEEQPVKASDSDDSSSSSSSEDEDTKLDLSSTTKLSDADLLKACGGRTAHKGARHGFTMSAKLARLEQQEQEFMNKYGKKNQSAGTSNQVCNNVTSLIPEDNSDGTEKTKRKKMKRKKPSENNICNGKTTTTNVHEGSDEPKKNEDSESFAFVNAVTMTAAEPKRKKKKNCKEKAQSTESFTRDCVNEESSHTSNEAASCLSMKENIPKKEKKKKQMVGMISEDLTDKQPEEDSSSHNVSKKKRKKKSTMDNQETSLSTVMMVPEDVNTEVQNMETDGLVKNRKKNKKKKHRKMEEQEEVEQVIYEDSVPKKKKKTKE